jgi:membrane-bound metal-dependent hydrolase YbcI (DUF457 family)
MLAAGALVWAFQWRKNDQPIPWRLLVGGALAWGSHFLLDSFYNHGRGIAIYWPFSTATLALPLPWFTTLKGTPPSLDLPNLRICAIELAFYLPWLLLALIWRWRRRKCVAETGL